MLSMFVPSEASLKKVVCADLAELPEGPDLYPKLLQTLADSLVGCLRRSNETR